ncbi:RDD family protein [Myxococcota bacterium]|nr:RDD family protein [Myxococcota bacterium]
MTARAVRRPSSHEDLPVLRAQIHLAAGRSALWQASLPRRFATGLTDLLILAPVIAFAATVYVRWFMSGLDVPAGLAWYDFLAVTLASFFGRVMGFWITVTATFTSCRYLIAAFAGRTPGMFLWKLDYTTADHTSPGPLRLCLREWVAMVSLATFGIGWIWAIFDETHRPLSDVVSGVYLIPHEDERPVSGSNPQEYP